MLGISPFSSSKSGMLTKSSKNLMSGLKSKSALMAKSMSTYKSKKSMSMAASGASYATKKTVSSFMKSMGLGTNLDFLA